MPKYSPKINDQRPALSLKVRLGLGAAALCAGTLLTAAILYAGMLSVAARLDAALDAEGRMAGYATLSRQAATFLVVASEAVQTGQSADARMDRITPISAELKRIFGELRSDVERAVGAAEALGLDEQSRYGTQSLGLARMEAALESSLRGLSTQEVDGVDERSRLRAHIDIFASSFDPLLSQAVNTELLFRNETLSGIEDLRQRLAMIALIIAALTVLVAAAFYFGLIRPQFARLDDLREAAHQIGRENYAIALPETQQDEIGRLYSETNRMAAALGARQAEVEAEWTRLNETIAARTAALQEAHDRLTEIDENRRRFFADISHELRTPLTVILMEAQIGQQRSAPDPATAFATIEARAARLNRRIDDLLRVARSDSGQLALESETVFLPDLIEAVIEEVRAEVESAGMEISAAKMPRVSLSCDPNWVRQVIVGLIRNSVRHARDGMQIALASEVHEASVEVMIADNGPGIPASEQDRLFERFAQGGAGHGQGFGIGLALARWVIEEHGGQITLISPVTRDIALGDAPGTKIAVRLPLRTG